MEDKTQAIVVTVLLTTAIIALLLLGVTSILDTNRELISKDGNFCNSLCDKDRIACFNYLVDPKGNRLK